MTAKTLEQEEVLYEFDAQRYSLYGKPLGTDRVLIVRTEDGRARFTTRELDGSLAIGQLQLGTAAAEEILRLIAAAKEAEQEIAALSKVVALADALAGEFERAVASRNPVSGMQVSPSGDFISCAQLPSAIKRMGWWAREIRAAGEGCRLTQTTPEVERLRARVAELEGYLSKAQVALVYFTRVRGDRILDRDFNWLMLDSDMKEAIINAHNKEHND